MNLKLVKEIADAVDTAICLGISPAQFVGAVTLEWQRNMADRATDDRRDLIDIHRKMLAVCDAP